MITPKSFQLVVSIYTCALRIPSGRSVLKKYKEPFHPLRHSKGGSVGTYLHSSVCYFPSGMSYFFFPRVSGFCDLGHGRMEQFELLKIIIGGYSALFSAGRPGNLEILCSSP